MKKIILLLLFLLIFSITGCSKPNFEYNSEKNEIISEDGTHYYMIFNN